MAANSLTFHGATPALVPNENFICCDDHIAFEVLSGSGYPGAGGNFYGEGKLFITNLRVIFVPNRPTPSFHSFFLPLVGIHDPKLDVPFLLGKTTIEGKVAPIVGAGLMGTGSFSITFPDSKLGKSIWEILQTQLYNTRRAIDDDPHARELHTSACSVRPIVINAAPAPMPAQLSGAPQVVAPSAFAAPIGEMQLQQQRSAPQYQQAYPGQYPAQYQPQVAAYQQPAPAQQPRQLAQPAMQPYQQPTVAYQQYAQPVAPPQYQPSMNPQPAYPQPAYSQPVYQAQQPAVAPQLAQTWACSACTLINVPGAMQCAACETARPAMAAQSLPSRPQQQQMPAPQYSAPITQPQAPRAVYAAAANAMPEKRAYVDAADTSTIILPSTVAPPPLYPSLQAPGTYVYRQSQVQSAPPASLPPVINSSSDEVLMPYKPAVVYQTPGAQSAPLPAVIQPPSIGREVAEEEVELQLLPRAPMNSNRQVDAPLLNQEAGVEHTEPDHEVAEMLAPAPASRPREYQYEKVMLL